MGAGHDLLAEVREDREAMGGDLEYPTEEPRSLDSQLDEEWLAKKIEEGKRMKSAEQKKLEALKEKYPNADMDWSREFGTVMGMPGVVYCQDEKFFTGQGKEVFNEEK